MVDPKKNRYIYLSLSIFCALAASILVYFAFLRFTGIGDVLRTASRILAPFIYGAVLSYLLRPACNLIDRTARRLLPPQAKKLATPIAVFGSLVFGAAIVYAVIIMIVPQMVSSIVTIWNAVPGRINQLIEWANVYFGENEELVEFLDARAEQFYNETYKWVQQNVVPQATNIVNGVGMSVYRIFMFLYNTLIGIIVAVYLLSDRRKFYYQGKLIIRSALPDRWAEKVLAEIRFIDNKFNGFINGKIVDSAIIGLLCYIGCIVLDIPSPILVSAIIGVTNVIPFFGPFIGAVPATLLILIANPMKALWFVIFVIVLQQVDGNIIGPKILGNSTGLSGFWVMFAIILFGGVFGIPGMVVGVPIFAVGYDVVKRIVRKGLKKKEKLELWEQYRVEFPSGDEEHWKVDETSENMES